MIAQYICISRNVTIHDHVPYFSTIATSSMSTFIPFMYFPD
ncbi:uncharacterized protein J3R85_015343 [Psidium guajava]|nr:uncharacterized protein J3R85_015343 [Psidium guajava]